MTAAAHEPTRPAWRCRTCRTEWPCAVRRAELVDEAAGSRVYVALQMARYFADAVADQPATSAAVLYSRFLGWVRAGRDHNPNPRRTAGMSP